MDDTQRLDDDTDGRRAVSRRVFLRGMSAGAGALLLAACGGAPAAAPPTGDATAPAAAAPTDAPAAAAPTDAPAAAATAAPTVAADAPAAEPTAAGFATSGDKGTINVIYWADSNDSFKSVVERFTKDTGIGVNYEVAPGDYLTWQQLMTTRLSSGDSTTDAFHSDDIQVATYGAAGWLEPLDDIIFSSKIDLSDWPQTLLKDVSSWQGKLYRLPWGNDTEIFLYRTDFFQEAKVQPPKTWDELVAVAKELTKGDRYGMALCGQKNGILGNELQHWTNQAGGAINALDKPGSKQAIAFYKDLFATYKVAPPSTPQEDYSSVQQGFLNNKYAMWWVWDGFYGGFRNNKEFWKNQVSAFLPPKGPDNAQTVTGCWGWSINSYSEKKDLAAQWVAYTAQPEVMKLQILRGRVPARVSLWKDPEVQDKAPSAIFLSDLAAAGDLVKARPITPSIQEIYDAAEQNIHAFLTDQVDIDTAIANAMEKIKPILDRDLKQ